MRKYERNRIQWLIDAEKEKEIQLDGVHKTQKRVGTFEMRVISYNNILNYLI